MLHVFPPAQQMIHWASKEDELLHLPSALRFATMHVPLQLKPAGCGGAGVLGRQPSPFHIRHSAKARTVWSRVWISAGMPMQRHPPSPCCQIWLTVWLMGAGLPALSSDLRPPLLHPATTVAGGSCSRPSPLSSGEPAPPAQHRVASNEAVAAAAVERIAMSGWDGDMGMGGVRGAGWGLGAGGRRRGTGLF